MIGPSSRRSVARRALASLVVVAALLGACGGDDGGDDDRSLSQLDADLVPTQIADLVVEREDLEETLSGIDRPYVDGAALYTLRRDDELMATLQVARFADDAPKGESEFEGSILAQLGASTPEQFRMGEQEVHLTTGQSQRVAIWFDGPWFYILSTRDSYETPRELLRATLDLELQA